MIIDFEIESQARVLVRFESLHELRQKLARVQAQISSNPPEWIAELFRTDRDILLRAIQLLDK